MARKSPPPPPPPRPRPTTARRLTPPPGAAERRRHPRYELFAQLQLRSGGEVALLTIDNISAGGLRIALGTGEYPGVRVGDDVSVFLDLGDDEVGKPLTLDAQAEIVRVDLGGPERPAAIALMWTSQEATFTSQLSHILRAVKKLAGE